MGMNLGNVDTNLKKTRDKTYLYKQGVKLLILIFF